MTQPHKGVFAVKSVQQYPPLFAGEPSVAAWEQGQRAHWMSLLAGEEYGHSPSWDSYHTGWEIVGESSALEGKALRKLVRLSVTAPYGTFTFPFSLFLPTDRKTPSPAVVFINNRDKSHTDPYRATVSGFWPLEELIARGWASAAFHTWDVETDQDDSFRSGIVRCFEGGGGRAPDAWATIAAWAFGASRVMDFLQAEPGIDGSRVAVAGHSRGGKAALWCAAQDRRFYSVYSNCSGCSGAALSRGKDGERVADINSRFPHWFCSNYKAYNGNELALPFDQHMLLACIAPRPLYIGSASQDDWADPAAEYQSLWMAAPLYALYGLDAVDGPQPPPPDQPRILGRTGYHLRTGDHDLTPWDWHHYLDFLESQPEFQRP